MGWQGIMVASTATLASVAAGSGPARVAAPRGRDEAGYAGVVSAIDALASLDSATTGRREPSFATQEEARAGSDRSGAPPGAGGEGSGGGVPSAAFAALFGSSIEARASSGTGGPAGPVGGGGAALGAVGAYDRAVQAVSGTRPADLVGRGLDRAL